MDPFVYAVAALAVFILGLSKGGFVGLGNLAVPLMAMVISPVQAAAVLLPILIVQDAIGIMAFWGKWDRYNLAVLLPGAFIGVALGYLLAARVSDDGIGFSVGIISLVFGMRRLILERMKSVTPKVKPNAFLGMICGLGSGFTSMIAHAGGPPFQIFVIPQHLPRDVLVGTTLLFFASVNLVKVVPYVALGQFTAQNLTMSAILIPIAILSTWVGVWMVRRIPTERFYTFIYILMIVVGLRLAWKSGLALFG